MNGLEIRDMHPQGFLAFDLRDVLGCLSDEALKRTWICNSVECTGEAADELEHVSSSAAPLSGSELLDLSNRIYQVIDGNFYGSLPGEPSATLVIRAIDSTLWEVFGNERCLSLVRLSFNAVKPARYEHG